MATTTNYGWDTPDDTDLVKDGAAAIRTLGSSVDTTTKALNPSTTLGDIEYRSATANTNTRLGIGTNGNVLTVSAGGVPVWSAPAGGADPFLNYKLTGSHITTSWTGARVGINPVQGTTYYHPIYLSGFAFDRIVGRTQSSFSGTATLRLGIYNVDATTKLPSTVFLDAGTASVSTSNTDVSITISSTPPAGYYYIAFNVQTVSAGNEWLGSNQDGVDFVSPNSMENLSRVSTRILQETGITGAFATAGTLTATNLHFTVGLRMA
jgi:hypothetical protein